MRTCRICKVEIPTKRLLEIPSAVTCDSICSFARKEKLTRIEAFRYKLLQIEADVKKEEHAPWPEPEKPSDFDSIFGTQKEGRAYQDE